MINQTKKFLDPEYFESVAKEVFHEYVKELGSYQNMTSNFHKVLCHGKSFIKFAQNELGVPLGALSEGSIERGNKQNKSMVKRFSRKNSFVNESYDVLNRRLWQSDPKLIWEQRVNTKICRGNLRKKRNTN